MSSAENKPFEAPFDPTKLTPEEERKIFLKSFSQRGNDDISVLQKQTGKTSEEIQQAYEKSFFPLKYAHLPFCTRNIKNKEKFWLVASPFAAFIIQATRHIKSGRSWKEAYRNMRNLAEVSLIVFGVGSVFSIAESISFEKECDIDSHFYNPNLESGKLIVDLKNKLRNR